MYHREEDQPPHMDFAAMDSLSAVMVVFSLLALLAALVIT